MPVALRRGSLVRTLRARRGGGPRALFLALPSSALGLATVRGETARGDLISCWCSDELYDFAAPSKMRLRELPEPPIWRESPTTRRPRVLPNRYQQPAAQEARHGWTTQGTANGISRRQTARNGSAHEGMKIAAPREHGEPRPLEQRLLSPEQAAAYLGLGSRFAVYRLVASGELLALRLANKLRVDLRDLDSMIENAKVGGMLSRVRPGGPRVSRPVPRQLAPGRVRRRPVTVPVTAPPGNT